MAIKNKFKSIMLIDDNEIDNLINQKMIESMDLCENILIHSGARSALEYLKNVEKVRVMKENYLPEMIFLDIDMPIMDGFQFVEEFEKLKEETKDFCKIVLLTSSLDSKDFQRSKKNKFIDKYLNKPLTQESLAQLIQ